MKQQEGDVRASDGGFGPGAQDDLRPRVSAALLDEVDAIAEDAAAVLPYSGGESIDPGYCRRVGTLVVKLMAHAVRDGRLDPMDGLVTDFRQLGLERGLHVETLFAFVYLTERAALDELALHETIGATREPWPLVAQFVRRAAFDLLAAYSERVQAEPNDPAIVDRSTTLFTRPVFIAALGKAVDAASRFGDAVSLILFDIDHLAAINRDYGRGVGDRVLERLAILIRTFFRQHDWVARYSEDTIAVLLSRTVADDAALLAERVRAAVEERLEFLDYRSERPVRVTVSAGIVNVTVAAGQILDAERLMLEAEAALQRAKASGRNLVERVDTYSRSS